MSKPKQKKQSHEQRPTKPDGQRKFILAMAVVVVVVGIVALSLSSEESAAVLIA